jgi:hypothetical protein
MMMMIRGGERCKYRTYILSVSFVYIACYYYLLVAFGFLDGGGLGLVCFLFYFQLDLYFI